jgi:hypothetical protein
MSWSAPTEHQNLIQTAVMIHIFSACAVGFNLSLLCWSRYYILNPQNRVQIQRPTEFGTPFTAPFSTTQYRPNNLEDHPDHHKEIQISHI